MKEAILKRISTRTYKKEQVTEKDIQTIYDIISQYNNRKGPFDHSAIFNINLRPSITDKPEKIGTYGVIKNAPLFLGGVCLDKKEAIIDYGYLFEMIVLELTMHQFDTCWLGGTFKKKDVNLPIPKGHIIPAVTPIGHRAEKRTLIDRAFRSGAQSQTRKSLDEILFGYQDTTFELDITARYIYAVTLVRKAPSASNKQPWRIYVDNEVLHFYLYYGDRYASKNQYLDMGIALSHFEIGLQADKIPFKRFVETSPLVKPQQEYIMSYHLSK